MATTSSARPATAAVPQAPGPERHERGTPGYRRLGAAMWCAGLAMFVLVYCVQGLLPTLASQFGLSSSTSSLALSATTGALAIAVVPLSTLAESWGRVRVMTIALAATAVLGVLAPLAPNFPAARRDPGAAGRGDRRAPGARDVAHDARGGPAVARQRRRAADRGQHPRRPLRAADRRRRRRRGGLADRPRCDRRAVDRVHRGVPAAAAARRRRGPAAGAVARAGVRWCACTCATPACCACSASGS